MGAAIEPEKNLTIVKTVLHRAEVADRQRGAVLVVAARESGDLSPVTCLFDVRTRISPVFVLIEPPGNSTFPRRTASATSRCVNPYRRSVASEISMSI